MRLTLHHIAHATPDIAATAALYARRFGYAPVTPVLHDPLQTALVQFLQLPGDPSYLELVAPDSPASKLTNAVRRGGGLNHLCYTCADMEATISHLEQNGMRLIADPRPGFAFAGRRICWLLGAEPLPIELVEQRDADDRCDPGAKPEG